jgi:hypothetical protein
VKASDELTQKLVDQVNATRHFWLGTTRLNEQLVIRIAIRNLRLEKNHLEDLWDELKNQLTDISIID